MIITAQNRTDDSKTAGHNYPVCLEADAFFYYLNLSGAGRGEGRGGERWNREERGGMGRFGSPLFSCHAVFVSINAPSL